jgi:hypothetical protein
LACCCIPANELLMAHAHKSRLYVTSSSTCATPHLAEHLPQHVHCMGGIPWVCVLLGQAVVGHKDERKVSFA